DMTEDRQAAERDMEETLGLVPEFFASVPDYLLPTEWASFKSLQLSDQTAIPNKYKEMIGLAVSGATRCRYCCYFHTEAARLLGAGRVGKESLHAPDGPTCCCPARRLRASRDRGRDDDPRPSGPLDPGGGEQRRSGRHRDGPSRHLPAPRPLLSDRDGAQVRS